MKILLIILLLPFAVFSQAPVNDGPCGAINIPVTTGSECNSPASYQWQNAGFAYEGFFSPDCGSFSPPNTKDVWFKFTATSANANILFSRAHGLSHNLAAAVYSAESCTLYYDMLGCDDDGGPDYYPQLSYYNFIPGQIYFIRVWQTNPATDSGSARICIVSEPLAPANVVTGINTKFPSAGLDVNGTMKIRGGTPGLNKVLTSDAIGNASWKAIPSQAPTQVGFGAYILPSSAPVIPCCSFTKLVFAQAEDAGVVNLSSGTFTAPETGMYHFDAAVTFAVTLAGTNVSLRLAVLSPANVVQASYETRENNASVSTEKTLTISNSIKLAAGQKVEVQFQSNTAIQINNAGSLGIDRKSRFQGYKIN